MSAGPPPSSPPPPLAPPPQEHARTGSTPGPRRLTRQLEGRLLGGVATGIATYLGVDVVVVRIALVVLAFVPFPGFGVLVYVAMLLLVPESDGAATPVPNRFVDRSAGFWIGIGLVGLAMVTLLGLSNAGRFGGNLVPLLLIGLGIALWVDADRRGSERRATGDVGPATDPVSDRSAVPTDTIPVWAASPPGPPGPPGPPAPPVVPPTGPAPVWHAPPVERRARSPLGRITVGLAFLAGGLAWLLDLTGALSLSATRILALVLVVLGTGLLVGSIAGRARWLAFPVALIVPLLLVGAAIEDLGIDLRGGVVDRTISLTDADQLGDRISYGAGDLRVDLTGVARPGDEVLEVVLGAGELTLYVPEGAGVRGTARLEVGELLIAPDGYTGGVSLERALRIPADPGRPTYEVDLRVGAGALRIIRSSADGDVVPELEAPEVRR